MTDSQETTTRTRPGVMLWPTLCYRDAPAAIRFLVEAFGFEAAAVYNGDTEDQVVHAELRWPGGGGVMLGSPVPERTVKDLPTGTGSVYAVTDDPDGLFARAVAVGATVVRAPRDEDYGSRDFVVRDPEGVYWSFGTYSGS